MIEFVLTADEFGADEFETFPATYITLQEDGDITVDFEQLNPEEYETSSVELTEDINAREHTGEYDNREENWILSFEPDSDTNN